MSSAKKRLKDLKAKILADRPAQKLADQATQLVFGEGSENAEVLFIGEAPGKQEDAQGKPFVGASGKMLNEMLDSVGMSRNDVYITNIVKYRPPENRDPLPEEKKAFWPYLLEQIAIIRPTVIATLGRHSGEAFVPKLKISKDHGQLKETKVLLDGKEESVKILPLYHPAAALYNGSLKSTLFEDFRRIKTIISEN